MLGMRIRIHKVAESGSGSTTLLLVFRVAEHAEVALQLCSKNFISYKRKLICPILIKDFMHIFEGLGFCALDRTYCTHISTLVMSDLCKFDHCNVQLLQGSTIARSTIARFDH